MHGPYSWVFKKKEEKPRHSKVIQTRIRFYLRVIIIYKNTNATLFLRYWILDGRKESFRIIFYYLPHLTQACALAVGLWENRCKSTASPISTGPFKLIHGHGSILNHENQRNWKVDLYAWFLGFYPSLWSSIKLT